MPRPFCGALLPVPSTLFFPLTGSESPFGRLGRTFVSLEDGWEGSNDSRLSGAHTRVSSRLINDIQDLPDPAVIQYSLNSGN